MQKSVTTLRDLPVPHGASFQMLYVRARLQHPLLLDQQAQCSLQPFRLQG
jgi:hypothetical protein